MLISKKLLDFSHRTVRTMHSVDMYSDHKRRGTHTLETEKNNM